MPLTARDREALTHWDIPPILSARLAPGGVLNRVIMLETGSGPLVLRAHREMPLARLRWEHRIIRHAGETGVPTPLPLPTRAGASLLELEGRGCAIFSVVRGRQLQRQELTPEHARSMGSFLAVMETRLAAYVGEDIPRQRLAALDKASRPAALAAIGSLLKVLRELPNPGPDDELALAQLEGQQNHLVALGKAHHPPEIEHFALIHGDFQDSNLFFDGDQVCAIIDWERARLAPWGWELVRGCDLMFHFEPTLCRAFLAGYAEGVPPREEALATTAHLYGVDRDQETWLHRVIYQEGNDRARRFLKPGGFRPFGEKWQGLVEAGLLP